MKSEERQVNTLIYSMGDKADDILASFALSADERKQYTTVKEKFNRYFVKKHNVIFECAKFNSRRQRKGETVDNFMTDLHCLAEHCAYGELHSEMIRDRIVVGLLDNGLSEKMQLDPNLMLERAVSMACQSEAVHKQQGIVRGTSLKSGELESENMEAVNSRRGDKIKSATQKHIPPGKTSAASQPTKGQRTQNKCPRCGKTPWHNRQQCPAKDAQCHKCQKTGHYSACCYSRQISSVTETTDNTFLGAIETGSSGKQWPTTIMLNKTKVTFKLDTGAEATAISAETYQRLGKVSLQEPTKILRGAANSHLSVIGQFTGSLTYKQTNCLQEIFVVKGLQNNLLGLPAIKALSLIQRLQAVFLSERSIKQSFPNLFTGLGTLGKEYTIKLKQGATPYALHTAR